MAAHCQKSPFHIEKQQANYPQKEAEAYGPKLNSQPHLTKVTFQDTIVDEELGNQLRLANSENLAISRQATNQ